MTNAAGRFEGSGSLEPEGDGAAKAVKYSFVIRRAMAPTRPGLPPAQASADWRGIVSASDGTNLDEGFYRLAISDGRRVRVQKLDFEWHILAPPFG
jgi:hypothetical protein